MTDRINIRIHMELLSDAIFGSGYSIPGGEDIAVCTDGSGLPYLKGSTLKGLLRESLENLLCWTGGSAGELTALLGTDDRNGADDGRRVRLSALRLADRGRTPEDCFSSRAFTRLENGTAADGSLRMARCVRSGLRFVGQAECRADDVPLLLDALRATKWIGTMRSRGFGRVRLWGEKTAPAQRPFSAAPGTCLRYRLRTDSPVLITDPGRSSGNSYETRCFLPGSALRGMFIGLLSEYDPEWFAAHRTELLSERVRFLDACPAGALPAIPSPMGFYEDKEERRFSSVLQTGSVEPGMKRAGLGQFCALREDAVLLRRVRTGGVTRIGLNGEKTEMFQTRAIAAGQEFEGCILLEDPALSGKIAACLPETVWLGADRYAGLGRCTVTALECALSPRWAEYGYRDGDTPGETLYLLAVSPFCMCTVCGAPCGLDEAELARRLGVERVEVALCSTAVREYGGYNRTWGCRESAVTMYDRGSLFKLRCTPAPGLAPLRALMSEGLGLRRAEGFGQILFLRPELYEGLTHKEAEPPAAPADAEPGAAVLRRARLCWIMERARTVSGWKLSKSQLGTVQSQCEKALACGSTAELEQFLDKNLKERGAEHTERFQEAAGFIRGVLDQPLRETLGLASDAPMDDPAARLRLLIELFDFSRKEVGQK